MINVVRRVWVRVDRAADGLAFDLALYAAGAAFAAATAMTSTLAPHRAWGSIAWYGYTAAALLGAVQLVTRRGGLAARAATAALAWATTTLLPLSVEAVQRAHGHTGRAQEEVLVVEHAGVQLLHHATPYLGRAAIAAQPPGQRLLSYVPYQPGMAIFGLPRALAGAAWWTDARIWIAVATAAALAAAAVTLRGDRPALLRAGQGATVLPVCALTLATGGDDLPVLALCLLALAAYARSRPGLAGLAVGAAGAMKLFAWPVAAVLLVSIAATGGRRALARAAAGALGLPVLALLPAFAVDAGAVTENLVRFPSGQGLVDTPAQSPLPGHLIAEALPAGHLIADVLLGAAGLAIALRLLRRPPRTAAAASLACAYGLLVAILLLPSTRFGYLLYPAAFALAAPALVAADERTLPRGEVRRSVVHLEG